MLDINEMDDQVMSDIADNMRLDVGEDSTGDALTRLSFDEAWERYLTWNGIIGYGPKLARAYENLKKCAGERP